MNGRVVVQRRNRRRCSAMVRVRRWCLERTGGSGRRGIARPRRPVLRAQRRTTGGQPPGPACRLQARNASRSPTSMVAQSGLPCPSARYRARSRTMAMSSSRVDRPVPGSRLAGPAPGRGPDSWRSGHRPPHWFGDVLDAALAAAGRQAGVLVCPNASRHQRRTLPACELADRLTARAGSAPGELGGPLCPSDRRRPTELTMMRGPGDAVAGRRTRRSRRARRGVSQPRGQAGLPGEPGRLIRPAVVAQPGPDGRREHIRTSPSCVMARPQRGQGDLHRARSRGRTTLPQSVQVREQIAQRPVSSETKELAAIRAGRRLVLPAAARAQARLGSRSARA